MSCCCDARSTLLALTLVAGTTFAWAPGASAGSGPLPEQCVAPPLSMGIHSGSDPTASADNFRVVGAVARRVPIVPRPAGLPSKPRALAKARKEAARTKLAMYQIFLSDVSIPRRELTSRAASVDAPIAPEPGAVLATLTIVPVRTRGFVAGDVARWGEELGYKSSTPLSTVGLSIASSASDGSGAADTVYGQVTVVAVDDKEICVDIDISFYAGDALISSAAGVVLAPVVRPPRNSNQFVT